MRAKAKRCLFSLTRLVLVVRKTCYEVMSCRHVHRRLQRPVIGNHVQPEAYHVRKNNTGAVKEAGQVAANKFAAADGSAILCCCKPLHEFSLPNPSEDKPFSRPHVVLLHTQHEVANMAEKASIHSPTITGFDSATGDWPNAKPTQGLAFGSKSPVTDSGGWGSHKGRSFMQGTFSHPVVLCQACTIHLNHIHR